MQLQKNQKDSSDAFPVEPGSTQENPYGQRDHLYAEELCSPACADRQIDPLQSFLTYKQAEKIACPEFDPEVYFDADELCWRMRTPGAAGGSRPIGVFLAGKLRTNFHPK